MSLYDDSRYNWRETYFVFTDAARRPALDRLKRELSRTIPSLTFQTRNAGDTESDALLESLCVISEENHSGVEILWSGGEQLVLEIEALAKELSKHASPREKNKIEQMKTATGKIEVLHFERLDTPLPVRPRPSAPSGISDSNRRARFQFDPDRYIEPPVTGAGDEEDYPFEEYDSAVLTPDLLLLLLEVVRRLTGGIAVDPAGGTIL